MHSFCEIFPGIFILKIIKVIGYEPVYIYKGPWLLTICESLAFMTFTYICLKHFFFFFNSAEQWLPDLGLITIPETRMPWGHWESVIEKIKFHSNSPLLTISCLRNPSARKGKKIEDGRDHLCGRRSWGRKVMNPPTDRHNDCITLTLPLSISDAS